MYNIYFQWNSVFYIRSIYSWLACIQQFQRCVCIKFLYIIRASTLGNYTACLYQTCCKRKEYLNRFNFVYNNYVFVYIVCVLYVKLKLYCGCAIKFEIKLSSEQRYMITGVEIL